MAFCLIMNPPVVAKHLSPVKLPGPWHVLWPASNRSSPSGTWTHGAIGDMPRTMLRPCGSCWQQPQADDYVIATGATRSVREFLDTAFAYVGLDWTKYVVVAPELHRPTEVDLLLGDATKAYQQLGWKPKISFTALVQSMVQEDLRREGITDMWPALNQADSTPAAPGVLASAAA